MFPSLVPFTSLLTKISPVYFLLPFFIVYLFSTWLLRTVPQSVKASLDASLPFKKMIDNPDTRSYSQRTDMCRERNVMTATTVRAAQYVIFLANSFTYRSSSPYSAGSRSLPISTPRKSLREAQIWFHDRSPPL